MKLIAITFAFVIFCFSQLSLAQGKIIKIDGSSTVYPVTEAVAEEFQTSKKGSVNVTVGISGTGGGFKKFCRGETDIQNASRPIQKSEMEACKQSKITYYELPVGYDALVVAVNIKNDWVQEITVDELKKMWEPAAQGKIMKWNQVNAKWPNSDLKLYGAGSDSGTFDYFTEAIVGKAKSSRGDFTASEDDNTLITGIGNDKYAIGYVPMSYYLENQKKLKALAIVGGEKSPAKMKGILPSRQSVENGSYFPLARPLFIYVSANAYEQKSDVKEFTQFFLKNGPALVTEVKYVALPSKAYDMGLEHLNKKKVGTLFGGEAEIGIQIEELLKREGKL